MCNVILIILMCSNGINVCVLLLILLILMCNVCNV